MPITKPKEKKFNSWSKACSSRARYYI